MEPVKQAKYILAGNTKKITHNGEEITLWQIRALIDIPRHGVFAGNLGGWIQDDYNLSQTGDCWIGKWAEVFEDARVSGSAIIYDTAKVYGRAKVFGRARIYGEAEVFDDSKVYGEARVREHAKIYGNAVVSDYVWVGGNACIMGRAEIHKETVVCDHAKISVLLDKQYDNKRIGGNTVIDNVGSSIVDNN